MSKDVDAFVKRQKQWREEIEELRAVLRAAKLDEELKWGKPCYGHGGGNIAIIQPFKGCVGLMFFKGALLKDPKGLLVDNGPNTAAAKRMEFRSAQEVAKAKAAVKTFVAEAIAVEAKGLKVEAKKEKVPAELTAMLKAKPALKKAFLALTPGRQRAYILHFAGAKQSETRTARIEKCVPKIMAGKGMND